MPAILKAAGSLAAQIIDVLNLNKSSIQTQMDPFDRPEPTISDYYADLGLPQQASFRDVKLAFFKLAKKHHPDKKAPGMCIDAQDFRKVSLQKFILRGGL
jgi:preprotein translocase subunit Sec63